MDDPIIILIAKAILLIFGKFVMANEKVFSLLDS